MIQTYDWCLGRRTARHGHGIDSVVAATPDDWDTADVVMVPGDGGPWALILAITDELAMRPRVLEVLSRGGRVVVHSSNGGKLMHFFHWYEESCCAPSSNGPQIVPAATPTTWPLMREVGCDLEDELDLDVYDEKAAVLALPSR